MRGGAGSGQANVPRSNASDIIVAVRSNTASSNGALLRFTPLCLTTGL